MPVSKLLVPNQLTHTVRAGGGGGGGGGGGKEGGLTIANIICNITLPVDFMEYKWHVASVQLVVPLVEKKILIGTPKCEIPVLQY